MGKFFTRQIFNRIPAWTFLLVLASLLVALLFLGMEKQKTQVDQETTALTEQHGKEVQTLIETYEVAAHNINTYQSADRRAGIFSGTFLDELNQYFSTLTRPATWTIVTQAGVTQIKVLDYSPAKIIALACVSDQELELNDQGKLVKQLPAASFAAAYVFVFADASWKLGNYLNVTDPKSARTTYAAMTEELQQLSGPVDPLLNIDCKTKLP
jgi:hypothetical protein